MCLHVNKFPQKRLAISHLQRVVNQSQGMLWPAPPSPMSQLYSVHHKYQADWPGLDPGTPRRNACYKPHEPWHCHIEDWKFIYILYNKIGNVYIHVTLGRVRVTNVTVKKATRITYSECVCSLSYPACKAHAPYYTVICGLFGGATIFFNVSHKRRDLKKMLSNINCVFWLSLQLAFQKFLILWRILRDIIINVHWCSCEVPVFLARF
jgi:hypothetical protein